MLINMNIVEFISFIMLITVSLFYSIIRTRIYLQWSQQSSYKNIRFLRRLVDKKSSVLFSEKIHLFILFLILTLTILSIVKIVINTNEFSFLSILIVIFSMLLCIVMAVFSVRGTQKVKHEKKQLIFTYRVVRLTIISYLLSISAIILYSLCGILYFNAYYLSFVVIISLLSPIFILLANLILLPIETFINKSFINDAIRIRKSMDELMVIGITGSYGKTSTKNIIRKIVSQKYLTLQTPENYNTELGITRTIREKLLRVHQFFVVEMGAKQLGDIKKCCEIAQPNYGVLTVVGKQHLETFKTEEAILKTKSELVKYLDSNGIAFLNADDSNTEKILPSINAKKILFGINNDNADVRATDIKITSTGSNFRVIAKNISLEFKTKLLGKFNIYNILAGISVGISIGVPMEYIKYAVSSIEPIEHRLQLINKNNAITIIDDSYNSNPNGFNEALNVLSSFDSEHRKIIVTPGMIELGKEEYELNKAIGKKIAKNCDYVILVGEKRVKPLIDGIEETNFDKNSLFIASSLDDARKHLNSISKKSDIILFENDLPDVYA